MKTSAVLLALVGSASAFTAPAVPSLRTTAAPRTTMSARPEQNAAAAAIAGALLLSSPMAMPDSAFAAVAPNPYAKPEAAAPAAPVNRDTAGGPSPAVIVGGVLVGSVALSFPFFKRSVERMGEKAQGKR